MSIWTILLAGGDGTRLHEEARRRYGYARAKQFCDFDGTGTLLDHTIARARSVAPRGRTVVVTSESWHTEAREVLAPHPDVLHVSQPRNLGTTPGILLPLLHVLTTDPAAIVVIMPTDHHVAAPDAFTRAVRLAVQRCATDERVQLLGVVPDDLPDACGWIVPDTKGGVAAFREKPDLGEARRLACAGALVNSFVMAGPARSFGILFAHHAPGWWRALTRAHGDVARVDATYAVLPASNFSREVLEPAAGQLGVVRMAGAGWSDIGTPERLVAAMGAGGLGGCRIVDPHGRGSLGDLRFTA